MQDWRKLISGVTSSCLKQEIVCPDVKGLYADFIRYWAPIETTAEYRYDIFIIAIDQQAQELNIIFNEQAIELLILCTSLDPSDSFSSVNIDKVCSLTSFSITRASQLEMSTMSL